MIATVVLRQVLHLSHAIFNPHRSHMKNMHFSFCSSENRLERVPNLPSHSAVSGRTEI